MFFWGAPETFPASVVKSRDSLQRADYCLIESVYGSRTHERLSQIKSDLEDIIEETIKAGGTLMVPAFAMERTQTLLFHIHTLIEEGRIPEVPVFLDSPLAIRLTEVYEKFSDELNKETKRFVEAGHRLFVFPALKRTLRTKESRAIVSVPSPKIIIAGSGMSQGGRIIYHEREYLPDPKSTILFIGYQVQGSLGRKILEGAKTVQILGEEISVKCRVKEISGYSAHADQTQLVDWLREARGTLKKVFVVQGEEKESTSLAHKLIDELAVDAYVPVLGEAVVL